MKSFELEQVPEPIEGTLHVSTLFRDMFEIEFIESVGDLLTFTPSDRRPPIYNAAGRNYHIPLPKKVGPFDALQIAGGGNFDLGIRNNDGTNYGILSLADRDSQVIEAPKKDLDLFTSITCIYQNGSLQDMKNTNPTGAYSARSAERKISNTKEVWETLTLNPDFHILTPRYVGRFESVLPDQNGEPRTAILLLVPEMGERFEKMLLYPLRYAVPEVPKEIFTKELTRHYDQHLLGAFVEIGEALAEIHSAGINHNQPTGGNMLPGAVLSYVTDWDTMTWPDKSDKAMANSLDFAVALQTSTGVLRLLLERESIDFDTFYKLSTSTLSGLLGGYYQRKGYEYVCTIPAQEAMNVIALVYDAQKRLECITEWLSH